MIHRARSFRRNVRKDGTPGPELHPGQGLQHAARLDARPQPEPGPDLRRGPARLPPRPHLPARGAGGRLQGRPARPGPAPVRRPHDRRPAGEGQPGAGLVRGLDEGTGAGRGRTGGAGRAAGRQEHRPGPPDLLRPARAADAAGGAGPQLPADPPGHAAAVRLPHPACRLRLAGGDASSTRRSGAFKNLPDDLPEPPVAGHLPQVRLEHAAPVPRDLQGPAVRLPRQAGPGRHDRVVHEAGQVRQFAPAGIRLRRLGPVAGAEGRRGGRVGRLPGRDRGPAAGLPGPPSGGPGTRRRQPRRQPAHGQDAVRAARPGRVRGQGRRPGRGPARVRPHRAVRVDSASGRRSGTPRPSGGC